MKLIREVLMLVATALWASHVHADAAFDAELAGIQQAWAVAQYETPEEGAKKRAFETLSERAHAFSTACRSGTS